MKWNYDLTKAPTDNRRFLALWHWCHPERDVVRIVWLAEKPNGGYRYLCDALDSTPYYIDDPHAFCLIPEIDRATTWSRAPGAFADYLRTKAAIRSNRMASRSVQLKAALLKSPMLDRIIKETNLNGVAEGLGFSRKEAKTVWEGFRATSKRKRSKQ